MRHLIYCVSCGKGVTKINLPDKFRSKKFGFTCPICNADFEISLTEDDYKIEDAEIIFAPWPNLTPHNKTTSDLIQVLHCPVCPHDLSDEGQTLVCKGGCGRIFNWDTLPEISE